MATAWTRTEIAALVRSLTGLPSYGLLSSGDLVDAINRFYVYEFPREVSVDEFKGYTEFTTVAGTGLYSLPVTVARVDNPITCKDSDDVVSAIEMRTDPVDFFSLYPEYSNDEEDERNLPVSALVYGASAGQIQFYLRPVPDAIYTIRYWRMGDQPTELSAASDTPDDPSWGRVIAYGAAINILEGLGRVDEAASFRPTYFYLLNQVNRKQITRIPLGTRAAPSF